LKSAYNELIGALWFDWKGLFNFARPASQACSKQIMSVEENHLLQLLGEKLYHSIPKMIPRFYPPWRYSCNYRWMTEADFAGHNIVIAEENYEGKLVTPVLAILVPCPRRDWFNLPDLDTVLKFNNDSIAQLNWGCEGNRYPFVYKISYNSASI
jgi:hypothetical protein